MTASNLLFPLVAGSANGKEVSKTHRSYCFSSFKMFQPADTLFLEPRHLTLLAELCQLIQSLEIIINIQYFLMVFAPRGAKNVAVRMQPDSLCDFTPT